MTGSQRHPRRPIRLPGADATMLGPRPKRSSFAVPADVLAPWLIGRLLVRRLAGGELLAGRIVETEAYLGIHDRASHAFGGRRTARNEAMYGPAGVAYVYFTYGMHHCFNVVCGREGEPAAVLVRALEPLVGLEKMAEMRNLAPKPKAPSHASLGRSVAGSRRDWSKHLCGGPARLCQAMMIDRGLNGVDLLTHEEIFIVEPAEPAHPRLIRAARVGIDYAGVWAARKLRWLERDSAAVSVPATRRPRARGN